jgi:hypothetical protein
MKQKNTTAKKIPLGKVNLIVDVPAKTSSTAVVKTEKNIAGLKKAKDLAKKALADVSASTVSVSKVQEKKAKSTTVAKQVTKKSTPKKTVTSNVKIVKSAAPINNVVKSTPIQPVSLSRDPGGISAVTTRDNPPAPVFDPRKKVAFIQPITLSGAPLRIGQYKP